MRIFFNYIKFLLIFLFISGFVSIFTIFYTLWKYSPELPSYQKIIEYKPNLSSRIYSSDGYLLKSFYTEERIFIPENRIPETIKYAFLASEDKNFYNHYGIDIIAIFRAFFTNIININSNKRVVGASTITQQVVKNLLLSNELSYSRKIKEIILAIRIENILNKDDILELYLNDIYLGYGSYGIGSASLNYFNKSIYDLQLHEIAFLASLPKAPNNYNPKTNYLKAIERRNWVIDRMYLNEFISKKDLDYKNKPIEVYERVDVQFSEADYFYEEIRKKLYKKFGREKLYSEGLIIKTALDSTIQKSANLSLIEGLIDYEKRQGWHGLIENTNLENFLEKKSYYYKNNPFFPKWETVIIDKVYQKKLKVFNLNKIKLDIDLNNEFNKWLSDVQFKKGDVIYVQKKNKSYIINQEPEVNGAIIVLDPYTGDILALSGGYSFKRSEFNRATQAKRQPGSAFKPIVYLAALNEGYSPATLILDAPYVVDQGPGLPKWKPSNYTDEFYGLTTMRTGIEKSRNLMTVRLANRIGMNKILNMANNFDINEGLDDNLSMSLGSGVLTLKELTNAYAIIANGGKKIQPKLITSIYSKDGKKIYDTRLKKCFECRIKTILSSNEIPNLEEDKNIIIDPKLAFQITSMMEGVIKRGTAKKLKDLNVPIAGKTGTTNKNKDAWFIGYTPDLVIGVYVGYDKPKSLGFKQTGSSVAVPIFKNFAEKIKINKNKKPFRIPDGISFVRIDPASGKISTQKDSIVEPFILGSEPYEDNISIIDGLENFNNNSISGTGGLLQ
ncbi:PBP1A family penicillin-binding protein [Pelagibacteraceae bacterium]|nr:PBP1A family penicillin-binding protein [Pelagibacteraceae bacterium]